ncbi:MAG: PAS domain S-box protein [Promethearchaeota archaeon]|jgi:PAS domain S-box-containing protein
MTQFEKLQDCNDQNVTELNAYFGSIINAIKNGVWVTNKDDVIIFTNKGMEEIAGISSDHIIGAQVLKDFPESTLKFFNPVYIRAKEKLKPFPYEAIPVITPAGRQSYQSGWLIPRIKDEIFDGMICTVEDITVTKKAELKLTESEKRYHKLFENMTSAFAYHKIIVDEKNNPIDYEYLEANPAFEVFTGLKRDEIIGKTVKQVLPGIEDDPADWIGVFGEVALKQVPINFENYSETLERWYNVSAYSPKKNFFAVTFTDITKRKNTEEMYAQLNLELELKVKERTSQLQESEGRYRELFNNMSSGVAVYEVVNNGADFIFADFNLAGEKIENIKRESLMGKRVTEVFPGIKNFGLFDVFQRVYRTGKPEHFPISLYKDSRISGWRDNYVYKLPTDELIVVYDDVSDKKKAELKLKESEERFSTVWYMNSNMMALSNLENGEFVEVNNAFLETIKVTREEIIGKSAKILYDNPKDRNILLGKLKKGGKLVNYELKFKNALGEPLIGLFSFDVVEIEGKSYLISVAKDISERKQAEQELEESENRFRSTFEQAAVGIAHVAPDGTFLRINQRYCDIVKYSHTEMLSLSFQNITHPDDLEEDLNFVQLMLMGKLMNYSMEKRYICKDNSIVWVNLTVALIRTASSNPKYFISVVEDISEKKAAEEKLQESEESYRLFVENFHGIAFKGYRDFSIGFFQGAIEKITGYEEEDFKSEFIKWDQLIHPKDRLRIRKEIDEFHESPQNSAQREYRIIDKKGKIHWLLESIQKIQGKSKNKDGVQGTIIDITDKKEAEELIIKENTKLLELNQMKIDLINRISHELKTPLNAVFGSIQLLLEDLDKESDEKKYQLGELIYKGGKRLKQIVFDLIESSKFELRRIKLNKKKEDLSVILKDCIEELIFLANKRKIFVSADLGEAKYLYVDRSRIEQVIVNIISNAINNTQLGGRIFIKLIENREYLDISIKDTGIGITTEEKDKLFKRFGKIERYGKGLDVDIDGWGLGLYISKEIVVLHGGEIIVNSEGRNKGAEFIIRLFKNEQIT